MEKEEKGFDSDYKSVPVIQIDIMTTVNMTQTLEHNDGQNNK